jgi:hypothetical protein
MKKVLIIIGVFIIAAGTIEFMTGCSTMDADRTAVSDRSGAQLWGETCNRCHNFRDLAQYDDEGWDVIGTHMRVRGNLTAVEHEKIVAFLKSGN